MYSSVMFIIRHRVFGPKTEVPHEFPELDKIDIFVSFMVCNFLSNISSLKLFRNGSNMMVKQLEINYWK